MTFINCEASMALLKAPTISILSKWEIRFLNNHALWSLSRMTPLIFMWLN